MSSNSNKVISSLGWSSISSILSYLILLARTFILIRFLAPSDFGVMALSLLLITILKQLSSIGLEQAVIQDDFLKKRTINTVWTVSIVRGILFFLVINLLSPYYANFFDNLRLVEILTIISFATIFNGFKNSYLSVAQKKLNFKKLFIVSSLSVTIEFLTTIILAIIYKDVVALAYGYLIGSMVGMSISFLVIKERPKFSFDYEEFIRLFDFGKWVFGGGILIFISLNLDTSVIGKLLGATLLGYYSIAFRFSNFAATDVVLTFSQSLYPSFSLVKDNKEILKEYFLNTMLIISVIILPVLILLGIYADSFVLHLLGENWEKAIWPLRILVIFGLMRSYVSICGFIFWSLGVPHIQSKILFIQIILITISIIPFTLKLGITGTAISVTFALMVSFLMHFYIAFQQLKIKFKDLLLYFSSIFKGSIFLLALISLIKILPFEINSVILFILNFLSLFTFYIMITLLFDLYGNKKIINLVQKTYFYLKAKNGK